MSKISRDISSIIRLSGDPDRISSIDSRLKVISVNYRYFCRYFDDISIFPQYFGIFPDILAFISKGLTIFEILRLWGVEPRKI